MIFSVIVPFLNEEPYIEQCINALLNQDFDRNEYELIFIDNGSTDSSIEIVRKSPKVILLHEGKKNVYAARNKGFSIAKGEIIVFTDADCAVSRDWLTQIYKGMGKANAAIALGKRFFSPNTSLILRMFEDYENAKIEYVLHNCAQRYYYGFTNNMAVKRDVFKKFGPFVELSIVGDIDFLHKCISAIPDAKVVYLNGMKITHLEISSPKRWLEKIHIYGEYNMLVKKTRNYSPLHYKEKLQIYNYCLKENNYPFQREVLLLFLLMIGDLFYRCGVIKGHIKSLLSLK